MGKSISEKNIRENIRVDLLTSQLMAAMVEKKKKSGEKINKSELIRSAIYLLSKEILTGEEFNRVVEKSLDLEKGI